MGLLSFLFGGESSSSSSSGSSNPGKVGFKSGINKDGTAWVQNRYEGPKGENGHMNHTWSETKSDGRHKEGFSGNNAPRTRDSKK